MVGITDYINYSKRQVSMSNNILESIIDKFLYEIEEYHLQNKSAEELNNIKNKFATLA